VTGLGAEALVERRHKLAEIERRTGAFLRPQGVVDTELDRLVRFVRSASGRVDPEAIVKVLKRAGSQVRAMTDGKRGTA
jgi:hypothetical protein